VSRTQRIAAVPILATRNPAAGANVRVEVKIVSTSRSIKAHGIHPIPNVALLRRHPNMAYCWRIRGVSGHAQTSGSRAPRTDLAAETLRAAAIWLRRERQHSFRPNTAGGARELAKRAHNNLTTNSQNNGCGQTRRGPRDRVMTKALGRVFGLDCFLVEPHAVRDGDDPTRSLRPEGTHAGDRRWKPHQARDGSLNYAPRRIAARDFIASAWRCSPVAACLPGCQTRSSARSLPGYGHR